MNGVQEYLEEVDDKRREAFNKLYLTVKENIPVGFEDEIQYGMIGFVVPLSTYPAGYLNREDDPLPFISLAAQKNHLALYHMGLVGDNELLEWFTQEYQKQVTTKLNMGKSCIRFTNTKNIPYELIGELASKISMESWINYYESFQASKKKGASF